MIEASDVQSFQLSDTGCRDLVLAELLAGDFGGHFVFRCGDDGCDDGVLVGASFFTSPAWHDWVDSVDVTCEPDGRVLIAVERVMEGPGENNENNGLGERVEVSYHLLCRVSESGLRCPAKVTTRIFSTTFGADGAVLEQTTEASSYVIQDGEVRARGQIQQAMTHGERCTVWVGSL